LTLFEDSVKEMEELARKEAELEKLDYLKHEMKSDVTSMISEENDTLKHYNDSFEDLIQVIFELKGTLIFGFEGKTADAMIKTMSNYHSKVIADQKSIEACISSCRTYDGWF